MSNNQQYSPLPFQSAMQPFEEAYITGETLPDPLSPTTQAIDALWDYPLYTPQVAAPSSFQVTTPDPGLQVTSNFQPSAPYHGLQGGLNFQPTTHHPGLQSTSGFQDRAYTPPYPGSLIASNFQGTTADSQVTSPGGDKCRYCGEDRVTSDSCKCSFDNTMTCGICFRNFYGSAARILQQNPSNISSAAQGHNTPTAALLYPGELKLSEETEALLEKRDEEELHPQNLQNRQDPHSAGPINGVPRAVNSPPIDPPRLYCRVCHHAMCSCLERLHDGFCRPGAHGKRNLQTSSGGNRACPKCKRMIDLKSGESRMHCDCGYVLCSTCGKTGCTCPMTRLDFARRRRYALKVRPGPSRRSFAARKS